MPIEINEIELPAFLAPALINGDTSSLTEADEVLLGKVHAWLAEHKARVVDVGDSYFAQIWRPWHPAAPFNGDCATYTLHIER